MKTKTTRVWVEIVVLVTASACALALLLATLGAAAGAAEGAGTPEPVAPEAAAPEAATPQTGATEAGAPQERPETTAEQTYSGMVTCSRCGARHSAALGQTATRCARACVKGGANFSLVDGDATYLLDGDLMVLQRLAGRRARVVGALSGQTIRISSVAAET